MQVWVRNEGKAEFKLASLAKVARRLGVPEPAWSWGERCERTRRSEFSGEVVERYTERELTVTGEAPRLSGWSFVATIEHEDAGNILRFTPEYQAEEYDGFRLVEGLAWRQGAPRCDICKTTRQRNDSYLVRTPEGKLLTAGSSCLRDVIGHANPEAVALYLDSFRALSDQDEDGALRGYRGERSWDTETVLAHTARMIRAFGWTSRGTARMTGDSATADQALDNIEWARMEKRTKRGEPAWLDAEAQDWARAQAALTWARSLTEDETRRSDYLWNLWVVVQGETLTRRQVGLAASALSAYTRHLERVETRRAETQAAPEAVNEYVGTLGERLRNLPVTVKAVRSIAGNFGPTTLVRFADTRGRQLVWWASGDLDVAPGTLHTLTGTVKRQEERQGVRETTVTRCTLADVTAQGELGVA